MNLPGRLFFNLSFPGKSGIENRNISERDIAGYQIKQIVLLTADVLESFVSDCVARFCRKQKPGQQVFLEHQYIAWSMVDSDCINESTAPRRGIEYGVQRNPGGF